MCSMTFENRVTARFLLLVCGKKCNSVEANIALKVV